MSDTLTFKSPNQKMHEIAPSLYLGSMFASHDVELLATHGITHILQVASEFSPKYKSQFVYKIIAAQDVEEYPIEQHFEVWWSSFIIDKYIG